MSARHLLLTTDVVGGVWDFCLVLAHSLVAEGDTRVTLLALGEPSAAQRAAAARERVELLCAPLKLEWMGDSAADVHATQRLVNDLVREQQPDVVHANQFAAACIAVDVPVVLTLHSDVLSWRRWTLGDSSVPAEWRGYMRLVQAALQRADSVVAVSAFLAGQVRDMYGVQQPIAVIHNAWPSPNSTTAPRRPRAHAPTTLVAGRLWDAAKNIALAAEAAQGWNPGDVFLAGEQRHPDTGARSGLPAPFEPLGFLSRDELDSCLDRADVYLSAARYDPFGLLPLQAALHACALLLADIPSYRELWDGAACFFRPDDAADLRACWQTLLADAGERAQLRRRARVRALDRYGPARMAAAYRDTYSRVRRTVPA